MDEINYMKFTIGEKITMLRQQEGKTLEEVAEHLKVSTINYVKWENDFVYPSDQQLARLGELYGLTYDQVITYGEN